MRKRSLLLSALVALLVIPGLPASAQVRDPAPADDFETAAYSYNESAGCALGLPGPRTPMVGYSGSINSGTEIRGPWGDYFGRNYYQLRDSMVPWSVPMSGGKTVNVHERALPAFALASQNLADTGNFYGINVVYGWTYRTIGGRTSVSTHGFGTSVDINPPQNPFSDRYITDMPEWFRTAMVDAGFCWGGLWEDTYDTMHYSWMGPIATPGYGARQGPYAPLNAPASFTTPALTAQLPSFTVAPESWAFTDRTRDGAADLITIGSTDGGSMIEMVGAVGEYSTIGLRVILDIDAARSTLADLDQNGWPEVIEITTNTTGSTFEIYSEDADSGWVPTETRTSPATGESYFGLMDDDFSLDLIEITRGPSTQVRVWSGASGFTTLLSNATVAVDTTSAKLSIGDRNVDGIDDIFVGTASGVQVLLGGSGWPAQSAGAVSIGSSVEMFVADYDGDGRDDLHLVDGSAFKIYLGGVPASGLDLDGWFSASDSTVWNAGPYCAGPDPCDSIGYGNSKGEWRLKEHPETLGPETEFFYGNPGDVFFAGDWDCDGIDTPGAYRQSDGYVYLRNTNTQGIANQEFFFGNPGDEPLIGDWNGDGCDTVSIYRPSTQQFFIINELGSANGGLGAAEFDFLFGNPGDQAFVGDFDGDNMDEVGLHRATTGFVYYRNSLTTGKAELDFFFGDPGDVMTTGDWNGDGRDTLAVYRPSDGNWFIKDSNSAGPGDYTIHFHDHEEDIKPVTGIFGALTP